MDNLHTLNIRTEHLDRHLNTHTSEFVAHQEGGINAAELDAQHHTVEGVAVLESHAHNITGLDTAGIPAVIEQGLALTLGVKDGQLGLGDLRDGVFACLAGGGRSRVDLDGLGS